MTRGAKLAIGAGVALAGIVSIGVFRPRTPIPVQVATVERGVVEERVSSAVSGDLEPMARAALRAEIVARIIDVKVRAGDRVKAGDELIRFEDRPLAAAAAAAKVQRATADREFATAEALAAKGIVTGHALDAARSARDLARANQDAAQANLARARVTSPFDGLVSRLPVQEGDSVVVGQAVGEVIDDTKLFVRAAFDEVDAVRIQPGDDAMVRLDAYPDDPLLATVDRVDPVVGGDSIDGGAAALPIGGRKDRTVGIRVALQAAGFTSGDLPEGARVLVGMSADVEVVLSRRQGVLRVPSASIFHDAGQRFAWVLADGRLKRRPVLVGAGNWEYQEVVDGLGEGDQVLSSLDTRGVKDGVRAVAFGE